MGIVVKAPSLSKTIRTIRRRKVDTTPTEQPVEEGGESN